MLKKVSNKIIFYYTTLIFILICSLLIMFNDLVRDTHLDIIKKEMKEKIDFIELVLEDSKGSSGLPEKNILHSSDALLLMLKGFQRLLISGLQ